MSLNTFILFLKTQLLLHLYNMKSHRLPAGRILGDASNRPWNHSLTNVTRSLIICYNSSITEIRLWCKLRIKKRHLECFCFLRIWHFEKDRAYLNLGIYKNERNDDIFLKCSDFKTFSSVTEPFCFSSKNLH